MFLGSNENYKRFSKYGVSCQVPFSSLLVVWHFVHFLIPPPPYSCSKKQKHSVLIYPCACGIYIPFKPIPFQRLCSYLTSHPSISFYFHFMYTPQHRTALVVSFLSIPQAPFMQSVTTQAIFLRISSGMFLSSTAIKPNEENPF